MVTCRYVNYFNFLIHFKEVIQFLNIRCTSPECSFVILETILYVTFERKRVNVTLPGPDFYSAKRYKFYFIFLFVCVG
jgi:hypothetical protein